MPEQNNSHVVEAECFKLSPALTAEEKLLIALTPDTSDTWIHGVVTVVTWICQSRYVYYLKLLNAFVKVVTYNSHPLPKKSN